MVDKNSLLLNEKIRFDKYNENVEEEYKRKYNIENKIDEYFDDNNNSSGNSSVSSSSSTLSYKKRKEKLFLYKYISPFMDLGKRFYSSLTLMYEPKLYHLSIFLTTLWAYKNIKCINKLLIHKYNDIHYQITRPDSLNGRRKAFRMLALGGSIIPCFFIALFIYDMKKEQPNYILVNRSDIPSENRTNHIIPYTLKRNISHKILLLKEKILFFAKDLAENNNFKTLSREYRKNMNKRLYKHYIKKGDIN
ncbi:hypothetical protein PFAG_00997 [Plasmodium falciparum Santa Lucia]|uniref:Uncharacterized protein n=13 Tax=Plasmodium falciparum TaxID=5833 RepID=Q8I3W8_PLAF7|nr:conserved protein, unknown function [Plasmodium falciparum 3D7]ETW20143.1 hypothetical protein PFFVO_01044 [Plasmodium falciparum Vietnam Oak-Knoll (FVO)]ETW33132.1 hypothetical protein PFTANZ_06168 [Plasmodium falciparum Tanzania (2000708)]ETW44566.1 hypothetical protein PFNF135_01134 [Plasmodium falciparum NF135/5.C10]ETW50945.1 hypothetical protein PFMALIP_01104 [Plasmodium falciparum MaliPS096_E11]ETW53499.1 hypothetical protein PFUGPA_04514 [Plasmodium falciparum Palo Alto/Uganda]ETW6|eukprot:XP_001351697.1 conserved Plasmodium protein, unknown function [Plasmodium falciparum 3D7]